MGRSTTSKMYPVLDYIKDYKHTHNGNSPSIREIMSGANVSSTSVVDYYLKKLENEGRIVVHGVRQIEVKGYSWRNYDD